MEWDKCRITSPKQLTQAGTLSKLTTDATLAGKSTGPCIRRPRKGGSQYDERTNGRGA